MASLLRESPYRRLPGASALTGEAADRLAIRELVDAWAHFADRRLARQQSELFTSDGVVVIYDGDPATHEPIAQHNGRVEILGAVAALNDFSATTHFNGQHQVVIDGDHARGESYCLAHHFFEENGRRKIRILGIRYDDEFIHEDGRWFFEARKLVIDWSDTRESSG